MEIALIFIKNMALYDNKLWLLSHIRNSFISTDDTGMSELVMVEQDIPKYMADKLDCYHDPEDSEEDDDMSREPYDIHLDVDFESHRQRSNTAVRLEKLDQAKKRAARVKNVKWELSPVPPSAEEMDDLFTRKDLSKTKEQKNRKSLLSEHLERCYNLPQNPYIEYARFDGSAQVAVMTRKYKIFLTMLPEEQRNYPMYVCCIASATIEDLIGFILLKCSTIHGDFHLKPVSQYGLYITEEDGEVDRDFPNLDPKECVARFGFTCLGLVEHKPNSKNVSFETTHVMHNDLEYGRSTSNTAMVEEAKQITANMQLMKVHTTAMEAPLYQSYTVYIVNKVRAKAEIHLGISGEKIEIDPLQQKTSKFTFVRQKPVSHHIDSVAWCEITDTKSSGTSFRVVYSLSFGSSANPAGISQSPLQTSASFKHYDFEADHQTAEEIVQKINLILELRSSVSRKEYVTARDRKQKKKNVHFNK